jgi:hypothetical protein
LGSRFELACREKQVASRVKKKKKNIYIYIYIYIYKKEKKKKKKKKKKPTTFWKKRLRGSPKARKSLAPTSTVIKNFPVIRGGLTADPTNKKKTRA